MLNSSLKTIIYIPKEYDFDPFFKGIEKFKTVLDNNKYKNNYDYNLSINMLNQNTHYTNNFLILKEDSSLFSPTSVIHYEYYDSSSELEKILNSFKDQLQCIVGKPSIYSNCIDFGKSQTPEINDYSDGIDTMKFLTNL